MTDLRDSAMQAILDAQMAGKNVTVLISDSGSTCKIAPFLSKYPEKVVNVGIAEQNLVSIAAGISLTGEVSITANAAPFLLGRANEQVKVDVCYNNTNVKMLGLNAGFAYGPLGATHHCIDDISIMRGMGNVCILAPSDAVEAYAQVRWAIEHEGPVYIRMDNQKVPVFHDESYDPMREPDLMIQGSNTLVVTLGTILGEAYSAVNKHNEQQPGSTGLLNLSVIRPFASEKIADILSSYDQIVTVEEHSLSGGIGSIIAQVMATHGIDARLHMLRIPEGEFALAGPRAALRSYYGIDAAHILGKLEELA